MTDGTADIDQPNGTAALRTAGVRIAACTAVGNRLVRLQAQKAKVTDVDRGIQHLSMDRTGNHGVRDAGRNHKQPPHAAGRLTGAIMVSYGLIDTIPHLRALARTEGLTSAQTHELARLWFNLEICQRPWTSAQWLDLHQRLKGRL